MDFMNKFNWDHNFVKEALHQNNLTLFIINRGVFRNLLAN